MTWAARIRRRLSLRAALRDESGATLVELAMVVALFLLIFFGLIDFGRLAFSNVMAEKAMQRAARVAAVRPPACLGVPDFNERAPVDPATVPPDFGTSCGAGPNVCANAGTVTCTGDATNATASEVWDAIRGLMPSGTTIANIRFTYAFDPDLGFLGGPYVPVVTAELDSATFEFIHPLGGLAGLAGATDAGEFGEISLPSLSVSLPGEDLAQGEDG